MSTTQEIQVEPQAITFSEFIDEVFTVLKYKPGVNCDVIIVVTRVENIPNRVIIHGEDILNIFYVALVRAFDIHKLMCGEVTQTFANAFRSIVNQQMLIAMQRAFDTFFEATKTDIDEVLKLIDKELNTYALALRSNYVFTIKEVNNIKPGDLICVRFKDNDIELRKICDLNRFKDVLRNVIHCR